MKVHEIESLPAASYEALRETHGFAAISEADAKKYMDAEAAKIPCHWFTQFARKYAMMIAFISWLVGGTCAVIGALVIFIGYLGNAEG